MTDDGMWHIRLFQVRDLFLGQLNGQSADGIFQTPLAIRTPQMSGKVRSTCCSRMT